MPFNGLKDVSFECGSFLTLLTALDEGACENSGQVLIGLEPPTFRSIGSRVSH